MAPPPPASNNALVTFPYIKSPLVQGTMKWSDAIPTHITKPVSGYQRKNGTWVAATTRVAKISKAQPARKVTPPKKKQAPKKEKYVLKFKSPDDRDLDVTAAKSLHIEEMLKLMRPPKWI